MNQRTPLDDHEIDRRARQYAHAHRVNYAEALSAVVGFAARSENTAPSRAPVSDDAEKAAEAALDAKARQYAVEHGVTYAHALQCVLTEPDMARQGRESPGMASGSDAALDRRANAYARQHDVSYSEALDCVCRSFDSTGYPGSVAYFREVEGSTAAATAKQMIEGQWIEIFRAGTHVSDNGTVLTFTNDDVAAIATGYDPASREAPLVIGHPQTNHPAYGWVSAALATPDGRLQVRVRDVAPEFAEMVRAGRFRKRSACFYPPGYPSNPNPAHWYLRHVGFLGAAQPALAGLRDIALQ